MRKAIAAAALACVGFAVSLSLIGGGGATTGVLPVTVLSQSSSSITLGWTPPSGVAGYEFTVDGKRVSNTWDPSRSSARFYLVSSSATHSYGVTAVAEAQAGSVTYPPAPTATSPAPTTTSPPPPSSACTKTLAAGGDIASFLGSLSAGQTGCLTAGARYSQSITLRSGSIHGTPSAHVTLTSADPSHPATIFGRFVTERGADNLTLSHLILSWNSGGQNLPSVTIGSDNVSLIYDDISNQNTAICVNAIDDATYGVAHNTLIDHDRVHNCGQVPVTSYSSSGYFSHALYLVGYGAVVTNNWIYDNSSKGVLLRGAQGTRVDHNAIDGNGAGVAFGDLTASSNEVDHNTVTNSNSGCSGNGCNDFGVFSWWGSTPVGTGNSFDDNCLYGNRSGNVDTSGGGFTASNNLTADPLYVNRAGKNFAVQIGSPCAGDVPDGTPGP